MAEIFVGAYQHGSREILDYAINWSTVLTAESDSAASSEWFVESGSPTLGDGSNGAPAPSLVSSTAVVWVVEGTLGNVYHLTNVLTGSSGRKYEASIKITVVDK